MSCDTIYKTETDSQTEKLQFPRGKDEGKGQLWSLGWACSVSHSFVSDFLRPHGPQHARLPCPSPTPRVYTNSCPSSQWCHPAISSSVVPFSSHLQSFPASGSFPMSQLFASGGQSIGVSASTSVLPMYTLLYFKWITNKVLLCSTWTSAQCYVEDWMRREAWRRMDTCICMAESHGCAPESVTLLIS